MQKGVPNVTIALSVENGTFKMLSSVSGYRHEGTVDSKGQLYCTADGKNDIKYEAKDEQLIIEVDGDKYYLSAVSAAKYMTIVQPLNKDVKYHKDETSDDKQEPQDTSKTSDSSQTSDTSKTTSETPSESSTSSESSDSTSSKPETSGSNESSKSEDSHVIVDGVPHGQGLYTGTTDNSGHEVKDTVKPKDNSKTAPLSRTTGRYIDEKDDLFLVEVDRRDGKMLVNLDVRTPNAGLKSTHYFAEIDENEFLEKNYWKASETYHDITLKDSAGTNAEEIKLKWTLDRSNVDIDGGAEMALFLTYPDGDVDRYELVDRH